MSRLSHHQNKEFAYKTFLLVGLIIAAIVFFISFGFKILINGSLFVNQLANGGNTSKNGVTKNEILTSLLIDPPLSATSSSHLIVSGSTVNFDQVEIYLNSEKITDAMVIDDSFSEEITGLEKGSNTLYFIAKSNKSKDTKKSTDYTVIYKSDKPKLDISSPTDGSKTNKQEIQVSGTTDKETFIKINGQPIVTDAQGNFVGNVKLNNGDNTITVIAEDIVSTQETKTIKVNYSPDN